MALKSRKKLVSCFCIVTNMNFQDTYPTTQKNQAIYLERINRGYSDSSCILNTWREMNMTVVEDYCKKLHALPQTFLINLILNINSVSDPDRILFQVKKDLEMDGSQANCFSDQCHAQPRLQIWPNMPSITREYVVQRNPAFHPPLRCIYRRTLMKTFLRFIHSTMC